jgi:Bifunctional DNA primase/polymerase, N-terminal
MNIRITANAALAFAQHNVPIFPVRVFLHVDRWQKRPCVTDWARRATPDILQIEDWWQLWPQAIVGVPLVRVGLVCVDADRHGGP